MEEGSRALSFSLSFSLSSPGKYAIVRSFSRWQYGSKVMHIMNLLYETSLSPLPSYPMRPFGEAAPVALACADGDGAA